MLELIKDLREIDRELDDENNLKSYTLALKCLWRLSQKHQTQIKIFKKEVDYSHQPEHAYLNLFYCQIIDLVRTDLDHKKKVIRRHAVVCVNTWSLL